MNILFTICARAGSKGVKGKNTRMFCGKPLVYYTTAAFEAYREGYQSENELYLAVNTDSELLLEQVQQTGVDYIRIERKASLAGDIVAKKDVIKDTLEEAERQTGMEFDVVADLDLTSPLRTAGDVAGTIRTLLENEGADIAYSVTEARRSPFFNMVVRDKDGYFSTVVKTDFVARQQAPQCYDMNASIYAYRRNYVLSERVNERRALVWVMEDTGILDIDSERDLDLMEVIVRYLIGNSERYASLRDRVMKYKMVWHENML